MSKTQIAKDENKKAEYKDNLSLAKTEAILNKDGKDINLDEYIEQIKADKIEGIKSIEKITDEKASVITKEGYIFIITVNTIEYYENENSLPKMDIEKANIEFAFNPNTWTNGSIEVTVSKKESKYDIQLSKDGTKWTKTNKMIFEENGTIYARLIDAIGRTSDYASRKIDIIDRENPVVTEATASTNNVIIKATDNASGIVGYTVTTSTTAPTEFTKCDSTKALDVTIPNLKQGTTYYAWLKDAAGNVSASKSTDTGKVTSLSITTNTANWSTSKTITIKAANSNYSNIRYTTNGTIPTSTTGTAIANGGTFTITSNCTIIAVAFDSTGQAGSAATNKVTTIDRSAPTIDSIVGSQTTGNTGTISINGISDANQSGISGIYISQTNVAPTASTNGWVDISNSNYSLAVSQNGTYYIWVKDKLGNISETRSCTVNGIVAKVQFTGYSSVSVTAPNSVQPALSYVGTPKSITYVSSNTGIASVNGQGVVTGVSVGMATITAIATNYDGTQTSIGCQVAVSQYLYGGGTGAFLNPDNMWIANGIYDNKYGNGWGSFGTYLPGTNGTIGIHNTGLYYYSYIRSYNVFDVTNASKMIMNINIWSDYSGQYNGTFQAGISDVAHQLDSAYDNTFVRCAGYFKYFNLGVANATVAETWTVDLNGVSGSYFFKMYMYKGDPNGYNLSFTVKSILLQP